MLASLRRQCSDCRDRIIGIHLEGPYISPEDGPRGAHPAAHVRAPDWDEFQALQEAAEGLIRLTTLAPEWPGACDFIRRAVDAGVVVAIGHTAASSEQIAAAANAGATLSTHLGNGAHGQMRRHPNYLWDQLAEDRLRASLIADGFHLPPAVLKTFVRAKGVDSCILVSDITGMGGMPPGRYRTPGLGEVEVLASGKLVVAGQRQYLAGAARHLRECVGVLIRDADVTAPQAVDMASVHPSRLLGARTPGLVPGGLANLMVCDPLVRGAEIGVRQTWIGGKLVYSQ